MFFAKVSMILILTVISSTEAFNYNFESSENSVGKKCVTKNNEPGFCQEYLNCKSAQQLYYTKQTADITMCKFTGNVPIVCCPSKKSITIPKTKTSYVTKPIKKISSKFQKALCKNVQHGTKIDDHITNGEKAAVGEFPFQVALGYNNQNGWDWDFKCGGSLIADDVVLTAAHCVNKKDLQPVIVRLGRTSLDLTDEDDETEAQDIEIDNIIIHPNYSRITRHNDIALIKLRNPVAPSDSVDNICLSTKDKISENEFTITGFGRVNIETHKTSDWLLKGTITEYPLEKCKENFGFGKLKIVDSQFCALGKKGVDACQGDSGGPVFYEQNNIRYLQAITSFGSSCGGTYPAVYTRVFNFLDWIEEVMSDFEFKFRSF